MSDRVPLGRTGREITALGIGAWAWGQRFLWEYGRDYGEAELRDAFVTALDAGIDFFDTAEVYGGGASERMLGRFLRDIPPEHRPRIATKFNPFHPLRWHHGALLQALRGSLARLELAKIDLYQIHVPYSFAPPRVWIDALADACAAGLTEAVGVSNFTAHQLVDTHERLARRGVALTSNQLHFSLLHRRPEHDGLLSICQDLGITVIAYMPLAHGLLTGKYSPAHPPTGLRGRLYRRHALQALEPLLDTLARLGASREKTPAQVALNWVLCKGAVPIVGVKHARQVRENLGALGWRLAPEEVAELDTASRNLQRIVKVWW